ncbi:MAG: nucleoside-diphosphate kinase [Methanosarcinales archaeon]|nr:nucleoside-diphosphate kinase [Methanosarcinales archaeon]
MERTYSMIKPDGVARGLMGEILGRIEKRGLKIIGMKFTVLEKAKVEEHYAEHSAKAFYAGLVEFVASGPSLSLVIEGNDSVKIMRAISGETDPADAAIGTVRGDIALAMDRTLVHTSHSLEAAEREIKLHFGGAAFMVYKRCDEDFLYE